MLQQRECTKHGITDFYSVKNRNNQYWKCKKCNVLGVLTARRKLKIDLVNHFGGACQCCGYNKCIASLDFHHLNPNEKEFGIGESGAIRSLAQLIEEAKKCLLVCSNCHREIHYNLTYGIEMELPEPMVVAALTPKSPPACVKCSKAIRPSKSKICWDCYKASNVRKKKIIWPSKEQFLELLANFPVVHIAKQLGVSDVAVHKTIKKLGIR